jgi:arginyl-tRNA synthetase
MKTKLQHIIQQALGKVIAENNLSVTVPEQLKIDFTKDKKFGDYASNVAMILAKQVKMSPRDFAALLVKHLNDPLIVKTEIAGPGFINFYINPDQHSKVISDILAKGGSYGLSDFGKGKKVHIEFVSANPTGPLHVGHGRGAAFGGAVADLLAAIGYEVHREYYVNDAGRQMHILATSVWLRYLAICGQDIVFPSNAYKGDYVKDIAQALFDNHAQSYAQSTADVYKAVPADEGQEGGDKEKHIDGLIKNAKHLLGKEGYQAVFALAKDGILADIKQDLSEFGVNYQEWFSEQSLVNGGAFEIAFDQLQEKGLIYEQEGAQWFKATEFGDDKDRVLVKENGDRTYFANDIAYHVNKYARGFDQVIDIFGADHHGYIPRLQAMLKAFDHDINDFSVLLVQFAILYRGKERVPMSTRSGSFVTLRQLRDEVGNDAARFFYVMRKNEQHMDFDLELAKSQSNDNPMYYIQYAHARICSVFRQLDEQGKKYSDEAAEKHVGLLATTQEQALIDSLNRYSELLLNAGKLHEPHTLANYLRELANDFHSLYNAQQFLIDEEDLCQARLGLIKATRQVLRNGLGLLGVKAPEKM